MKLKLSWEQGKFLLQQGKVKQVKASQGKSTSLQNRLLEVRVIVRVFGFQQVEKDVNKIQQQLRYCQQRQEQSRNVKKVFWTVLKVARRVLHICCLLTPPSSLPIATAATAHCDPLDECAEPQLPRRTSLEHIAALYWGTYGYIGPSGVVVWCGGGI